MKNKAKDEFNLLILDALKYFVENPKKEVYLREISRTIKISPNTAQRFLELFLKEKLITEERKANLRYFKANLGSLFFRHIKKAYAIKKLADSGIIDYLKNQGFSNVILFGSIAKGEDTGDSDIDLVCIGKKKNLDLSEFYPRLHKELNIKMFSIQEWRIQKVKNKAFYQDVISTGISLIGETPII